MNAPIDELPHTLRLGKTDIQISPLGIGCWEWGDRVYWGYGQSYGDEDIQAAIAAALEAGVSFFDTAEIYGRGRSERLLGKFLPIHKPPEEAHSERTPLVLATKFFPYPWRLTRHSLIHALQASLERLGIKQVDLYQVHWPYPPMPIETWVEGLADAVERGLTRAVGVSNYNKLQMRRAQQVLEKRGLPLASNQVEYHLLNRRVEKNGLLSLCQELGVTLIAYSPLAQGLLTGKYTPENPPPRTRHEKWTAARLERLGSLIQSMRNIGMDHDGKTPAQVALNWIMCKGGVPIPGVKNIKQAEDNCAAMGWKLTQDEIARLDMVSEQTNE